MKTNALFLFERQKVLGHLLDNKRAWGLFFGSFVKGVWRYLLLNGLLELSLTLFDVILNTN